VIIGALKVRLQIYGAHSLKEKRKVLKSIKDRLAHMNAAIAEVDDLDKWQAATLGLAVVSNEAGFVNSMLDKIMNVFFNQDEVEIIGSDMEILHL
jgi:uncharacterized protein